MLFTMSGKIVEIITIIIKEQEYNSGGYHWLNVPHVLVNSQ